LNLHKFSPLFEPRINAKKRESKSCRESSSFVWICDGMIFVPLKFTATVQ
jgi:hypothetical protein